MKKNLPLIIVSVLLLVSLIFMFNYQSQLSTLTEDYDQSTSDLEDLQIGLDSLEQEGRTHIWSKRPRHYTYDSNHDGVTRGGRHGWECPDPPSIFGPRLECRQSSLLPEQQRLASEW